MNPSTVLWLCIAGVVFYACSVDPNVAVYLNLWAVRAVQKCKMAGYSLVLNPAYPWVRLRIWAIATRNANTNARILRKELGLEEE